MPTIPITIAKVQEALKLYYLPTMRVQINEKTDPFMAAIEKGSENVVGAKVVMALRYGRNGGVGNRADDGDLPNPSSRKTKQAKWETKNLFARIMLTDKTMKASANSRGAFVDLLEAELDDAVKDAKENFARQLYGTGDGIITKCKANTTVTTISVDNTIALAEGMVIDVVDASTGTPVTTEREILSVDHTTKSIGISGAAITTTTSHGICVSGSFGLELTGLGKIFTPNTTIYEIDRSANKWMNPNAIAVGGELSELKLQEGIDAAEIYAGSDIDYMLASHGVRRAYILLFQTQKRIVNSIQLKGGWKGLDYNGVGLVASKYMPASTLYQLASSDFKLYQMSDFDWLDKDGKVLSRVANKAAYEATLYKYADMGCSRIKGQTALTGITEH